MTNAGRMLARRELADRYSADASTYDEVWSPVILPGAESLARALPLGRARRVLDVGTGAGALTPAIRAAAPHASVTGVDTSEGMLRIARVRHALPASAGEATALPVPTESVDAVILAFVLFHLADPQLALVEAVRVLRPGGRVGTVTWEEERRERASALWDDAFDAAGAPRPPERGRHQGLDSPDAVRDRLRGAGLDPDAAWTETIDYTFTLDEFWRLKTGFGNPRWRLEQLEPGPREALLRELRGRTVELDPEDLRFRGSVVLAVATRRS